MWRDETILTRLEVSGDPVGSPVEAGRETRGQGPEVAQRQGTVVLRPTALSVVLTMVRPLERSTATII
jgi:hypothetical protein